MSAMYLKNGDEIAAAARVAKELGYVTSVADIRRNDRFVINVIRRLEGMDRDAQVRLEAAIASAVKAVREARSYR